MTTYYIFWEHRTPSAQYHFGQKEPREKSVTGRHGRCIRAHPGNAIKERHGIFRRKIRHGRSVSDQSQESNTIHTEETEPGAGDDVSLSGLTWIDPWNMRQHLICDPHVGQGVVSLSKALNPHCLVLVSTQEFLLIILERVCSSINKTNKQT